MFASLFPLTRLFVLLILFLGFAPGAAQALSTATLIEAVGILPPSPQPHPDLEVLLKAFWRDYYGADGPLGLSMSNIRVGRVDLNDDEVGELILLIDSPAWRVDAGKPFVIATWRNHAWVAIGWGWGDEDTVFSMTEIVKGWHSLDTGTSIMRWNGHEYERELKSVAPLGQ